MAGAIIKVDPQVLISTASEFQSEGSNVQSLTQQMMSQVQSLSAQWQGEASTAFLNKFNGLEDDIQKMIAMINEYVTDLQEIARTYTSAEDASMQEVNNLSNDVIV